MTFDFLDEVNQVYTPAQSVMVYLRIAIFYRQDKHEAQPEQFKNAFSGIWWSVSTLLTVGYGDIYPITTLGKLMAIIIAFLGVGLVAIPTGIISAGFVEQYSKLKTIAFHSEERDIKFVTSTIYDNHAWNGKMVKELVFPPQLLLVMVRRKNEVFVPNGDFVLKTEDILVIGAKNFKEEEDIHLREIIIKEKNPWIGMQVRELDISQWFHLYYEGRRGTDLLQT